MKRLLDSFKKLTLIQQLIVVAILVILAWWAYNKIVALKSAAETSIKNKSEIEVLTAAGKKATYLPETYEKFATVLYNAMDGPGTDTDIVIKTFSYLNNDIDFIKLDQAFGIREASDNLFGLIESTDLRGWLHDDLSETLISQINTMLKTKGITKRI